MFKHIKKILTGELNTASQTGQQFWPMPVAIESPYSAESRGELLRNLRYLSWCLHDSYCRGEAPYAGHAMGPLCLDEQAGRKTGLSADATFNRICEITAVYRDLGFSDGMWRGVHAAELAGRTIDFRSLPRCHMEQFKAGNYPPGAQMALVPLDGLTRIPRAFDDTDDPGSPVDPEEPV